MPPNSVECVRVPFHPDSLMDDTYEERTLSLAEFAPLRGPWTAKAAGDPSAPSLRSESRGVCNVSLVDERILRVRFAPQKAGFGPTVTESLGLLNAGVAESISLHLEKSAGNFEAQIGPFRFRFDPDAGDFAVEADGRPLVESVGGGARFSPEPGEHSGFRSFAAFRLGEGERIWGFGGRVQPLDRRGAAVDIFSMKVGTKRGDYGGFPVPFFISSAGYGIFFNNPWPHVCFDMGKTWPDRWFVAAPGGDFDLFVIKGPKVRDIVRAFTSLVGRIPPPQKELFGFWVSSLGFETAEQLLDIAERLRREDYPCDNLVLDGPWRGGPEFIANYKRFGEYMNNDLEWHPDFGDGADMLRKLHAQNYKVALHLNSRVFKRDTAEAALSKGLLRQHEDEVVVKLEDEAGERFFLEHLAPRIAEGADYWWTDHTDRVSGEILPGVPSRNLFGPLWNRMLSKAMADAGRGERLSLSRGGGIGSQTCALPWPGDTAAGLDRFAEDVWFCLNAGLAGFPVTSVDMGGFTLPKRDVSEEEGYALVFGKENLHRRLFQSLFFVPAPRIHNNFSGTPRLPWICPPESQGLYRDFLRERYKLTPYFFSLGIEAHRIGDPILRPLFYCFQDDPRIHGVGDVFMIGESLLVAPVFEEGAGTRRLFLPEGLWFDYWTGEAAEGGRDIERPCPMDGLSGLPVMVRGGSIIPQQEPAPFLRQEPPESLRLILYPDAEGRAALRLWEAPDMAHDFALRRESGEYALSLPNKTAKPRTYSIAFGDGRKCVPLSGGKGLGADCEMRCVVPPASEETLRFLEG